MALHGRYKVRNYIKQESRKLCIFIETNDQNTKSLLLADKIDKFMRRLNSVIFYQSDLSVVITSSSLKYTEISSLKRINTLGVNVTIVRDD